MTATYAETKHDHGLTDRLYAGTRSSLAALKRVRKNLASWMADMRSYHASVAELRVLSDRELDDLNIPRWQIPEIAWRSVVDRRSSGRD
ncbi:MAG: DUF1127 domain-containing protein [Pseudomonadota bacterium]